MSETKKKGESKVWGLVPDEFLKKALTLIAHHDSARYVRIDGSINRMRILHDLAVIGSRKQFTDWNNQEGLGLLNEHEQRAAAQAALRENRPLPATQPQTVAPAPTSTPTQTSALVPTEVASAPATQITTIAPTPTTPVKKPKRFVEIVVNESGHSRIRKVE